jgi:hypothetical protein
MISASGLIVVSFFAAYLTFVKCVPCYVMKCCYKRGKCCYKAGAKGLKQAREAKAKF